MNILITGVGGQGTILASKILAGAALTDGDNAMTGETIGMSQRGGCVSSHVRTGNINSPYIQKGGADLLLSLELCEGARNLPFLKPDAAAIVSLSEIKPVTVSLGGTIYNADEMKQQIQSAAKVIFIDTEQIARECGSPKSANMVLLGAASGAGLLGISREAVISAMKENIKERFFEQNLAAFKRGETAGKDAVS